MARDGEACKENENKMDTTLYIDSGAFKTIVNDPYLLHDYHTKPRMSVECAGDQTLYTEGTGTLKIDGDSSGLAPIENASVQPSGGAPLRQGHSPTNAFQNFRSPHTKPLCTF